MSGPWSVCTQRRVPWPAKSGKAEGSHLHSSLLEIISWCHNWVLSVAACSVPLHLEQA